MTHSPDNKTYEQDHSHTHCYDEQEGHENHLRCCICTKDNPFQDGELIVSRKFVDAVKGGDLVEMNKEWNSTQTSHDLVEEAVREFVKYPVWPNADQWLRNKLADIVEKTREEALDIPDSWLKEGKKIGKAEGRAEVIADIEGRLPQIDETGRIDMVRVILADLNRHS